MFFSQNITRVPGSNPAQTYNALNFSTSLQNYASLPAATYFSGDFTIECWVNPSAHTNWSRIIDFGNGAGNNNVLFATSYGTSGQPGFYVGGAQFQANAQIPLNQWTHLAATLSGTTATIYINGIASGTANFPVPANVTRNNNYIGRSNWGWGDPAPSASFDDLRIWSVAKTGSEILASMNNELSGTESNLVAYFKFNEGVVCGNNTAITTLTNSAATGAQYNATLNGFTLNNSCVSNFVTGKIRPTIDGLTSATAGTSAYQIKQSFPSSTDGVYWIKNANINGGTPFQIYADMTTDGGGWILLNSSGGGIASLEVASITSLASRGYLPRATVIELATISTTVQLRVGPANNNFTYISTSSDNRPITALRSNNTSNNGPGTWHNAVYTSFIPTLGSWSWADVGSVANGWPNMFHSNGQGSSVHWLPTYDAGSGTDWGSGKYFSTWIK